MENNYKRTIAGSVGAGVGALFNAQGRKFYILEHKTESKYHHAGESQKIIVDQVELGRDSSCQVRFDESFETVSRRHAAIVREGDNWKLIPISQTNATLVNGQPVQGEWHLNSGDEIRLSSRGPVLGFIVPQGKASMVNSIGLTERMNLFRQQALRPYKTALVVLALVLVLAVAGLMAWNLYQADQYEAKLQNAQAQLDKVGDAIDVKTLEIEELQKTIDDNNASSASQLAAAKAQLAAAKAEQKQLMEQQNQLVNDIHELKENQTAEKTEEKVAEAEGTQEQEAAVANLEFANIEDCYKAVYYIKLEEITIFTENNVEWASYKTDTQIIGGTGFMLNDGRFVTAHRVVEPWAFANYRETKVAKDTTGKDVTFGEIRALEQSREYKVVANYTAYSPAGTNFKFRSTDMTHREDTEVKESYVAQVVNVSNNQYVRMIKNKKLEVNFWKDGENKNDWATMAKADQLHTVSGLLFDEATSLSPVAPTEVAVVGFPFKEGFTSSHKVDPVNYPNNINVTGLNDVNIIELSSRRYQPGNDGAPVFQKVNGQWTVIGILSHTDSADRDVVVPISYAK